MKLLPCPFCKSEPELDTQQFYRPIDSALTLGSSVAIYCTNCDAYMSICREDVPELSTDNLIEHLTSQWNTRPEKEVNE